MKSEIANKWIEALESGKYQQTTKVLCKNDAYCCLGVLTELAIKDGLDISKEIHPHGIWYGGYRTFLPEKVVEWAGMKSQDGHYQNYTRCLSADNDSGSSFKEIAKIIREHQEEL